MFEALGTRDCPSQEARAGAGVAKGIQDAASTCWRSSSCRRVQVQQALHDDDEVVPNKCLAIKSSKSSIVNMSNLSSAYPTISRAHQKLSEMCYASLQGVYRLYLFSSGCIFHRRLSTTLSCLPTDGASFLIRIFMNYYVATCPTIFFVTKLQTIIFAKPHLHNLGATDNYWRHR